MSSTFLPWKFDNETGVRSPIVGRVKSGCLSPIFGAYGADKARVVEPNNIPHTAKVNASFRIVRLHFIRGARVI